MNIFNKLKRTCASVLAVMLAMTCMLSAGITAFADDSIIDDLTDHATLTITKYELDSYVEDENGNGSYTSIDETEFSIYKVIGINFSKIDKNDSTSIAEYSIVDKFGNVLEAVKPDALGMYSAAEIEALVDALSRVIVDYRLDNDPSNDIVPNQTKKTDGDGTVVFEFDDNEFGWYLVVETQSKSGYVPMSPFLVQIPSSNNYAYNDEMHEDEYEYADKWDYNVKVYPKNQPIFIEKELTYNDDIGSELGNEGAHGLEDENVPDGTVAVGSYVQYTLKSVTPSYPAYYEAGAYTVRDYLSDGLTIIGSDIDKNIYQKYPITVTVGNDYYPITEWYEEPKDEENNNFDGNGVDENGIYWANGEKIFTITASETPNVKNQTFGTDPDLIIDFDFDYLMKLDENGNSLHKNQDVTITYWAQVNNNAVTGTNGNSNYASIEYSNSPRWIDDGDGNMIPDPGDPNDPDNPPSTSIIPTDEIYLYSFNIQVIKFTNEGGEDEATTETVSGAEFQLFYDKERTEHVYDKNGDSMTLVTDEDGLLSPGFELLDEGVYYLEETRSPDGYTLLADPIKIEIKAVRVDESGYPDENGVPNGEFEMYVNDELVEVEYEKGQYVSSFDIKNNDATAYIAVENHVGFSLPTTGGIGIALFLAIGSMGVVGISVKSLRKKDD